MNKCYRCAGLVYMVKERKIASVFVLATFQKMKSI